MLIAAQHAADQLTPVSSRSLWTIEGLVALGTLALAAVTTFLAWRTSRMASETADLAEATNDVANKTGNLAEATERLATLTEQDVALSRTGIEAGVRPVLITVPWNEFTHPVMGQNFQVRVPGKGDTRGHPDRAYCWVQDVEGWLFVSVPVRNEGAGTALGLDGTLLWEDQAILGEITSQQVPPHEFSRASFGIPPDGPGPNFAAVAEAGSVLVRVTYIDLAGNVWATRLTLEPTEEGIAFWRVADFSITNPGRIER